MVGGRGMCYLDIDRESGQAKKKKKNWDVSFRVLNIAVDQKEEFFWKLEPVILRPPKEVCLLHNFM